MPVTACGICLKPYRLVFYSNNGWAVHSSYLCYFIKDHIGKHCVDKQVYSDFSILFSTEFSALCMAKKGSVPKLYVDLLVGFCCAASLFPCRQWENCNLLFISFFLCPSSTSQTIFDRKLRCVDVGGFAHVRVQQWTLPHTSHSTWDSVVLL